MKLSTFVKSSDWFYCLNTRDFNIFQVKIVQTMHTQKKPRKNTRYNVCVCNFFFFFFKKVHFQLYVIIFNVSACWLSKRQLQTENGFRNRHTIKIDGESVSLFFSLLVLSFSFKKRISFFVLFFFRSCVYNSWRMRLVRGINWWMITCQPHRRQRRGGNGNGDDGILLLCFFFYTSS